MIRHHSEEEERRQRFFFFCCFSLSSKSSTLLMAHSSTSSSYPATSSTFFFSFFFRSGSSQHCWNAFVRNANVERVFVACGVGIRYWSLRCPSCKRARKRRWEDEEKKRREEMMKNRTVRKTLLTLPLLVQIMKKHGMDHEQYRKLQYDIDRVMWVVQSVNTYQNLSFTVYLSNFSTLLLLLPPSSCSSYPLPSFCLENLVSSRIPC